LALELNSHSFMFAFVSVIVLLGKGQSCEDCYVAHKDPLWPCVEPYANHVPKLLHPQMAFVDCYCWNMTANCTAPH